MKLDLEQEGFDFHLAKHVLAHNSFFWPTHEKLFEKK